MRVLTLLLPTVLSAAGRTQSITGDLKGKLNAVKNKVVQPVDATTVTQARYIAFYDAQAGAAVPPVHPTTNAISSAWDKFFKKRP